MSIAEVPESYLAILASSPKQREDRKGDQNDYERQMLGLLDALARICVSQAEGEVYASAMETGPDSCTIFIIGNHEEVPQATQDYLTDVCRQLTDVANLVDTVGRKTPSIDDIPQDIRDTTDNILKTITAFTFEKFLSRVTKKDGRWRDRMREIDQLVDEADRQKFEKLKNALNILHQVATFHTTDISSILQVLTEVSRRWKFSNPDTEAFIRRVDLLHWQTCDQTDVPFLIERYLRKVMKTFNETAKLIHFALSPNRSHIFKNPPKLMFLRSAKRRVELDIKTAVNTLRRMDRDYIDRFLGSEGERIEEQYTCCPHCECTMLATILQRWRMQQRPAPIIGVSKLSCLGCHLFFLAYNRARSQLTETDLPLEFVVTGAHNTLYLPWVSPDLTSIDPSLHAGVQEHLLILARGASIAPVIELCRRSSESTTPSSEEGEVMKVLGS
ncbi:uncharacterized protein EV420DRAFT_1009400 [Desarmillaria tabescens]|uniref:Uncharacterized protein n=1 Tax=Armillaria tabescens TaxID=1929756 RepID=A0AA39JLS3_ARMTA|nr:uncharacterized protein EV420DRAFT_1009400 [Desarmillaria tabescens]KAK0444255.1 hypothetical protein EV420DRAFT_1009400 [Desarmillaria tabescens]